MNYQAAAVIRFEADIDHCLKLQDLWMEHGRRK